MQIEVVGALLLLSLIVLIGPIGHLGFLAGSTGCQGILVVFLEAQILWNVVKDFSACITSHFPSRSLFTEGPVLPSFKAHPWTVRSSVIACMSRVGWWSLRAWILRFISFFIMRFCVVKGGWVRCIWVLKLQRSAVPHHGELQLKSVMSYSRAQGPNSGSVEKQQIIFTPEELASSGLWILIS